MKKTKNRKLGRHKFHILLALADEDRHGSGIMREVLRQTDGELKLWPMTLYGSLDQLLDESLIVELSDPEDRPANASARRRYFRISEKGRDRLSHEVRQLVRLGRVAQEKLALS